MKNNELEFKDLIEGEVYTSLHVSREYTFIKKGDCKYLNLKPGFLRGTDYDTYISEGTSLNAESNKAFSTYKLAKPEMKNHLLQCQAAGKTVSFDYSYTENKYTDNYLILN